MTPENKSFNDLFNKAKTTKQKSFIYQGIKVNLSKHAGRDIAWLKMRNALVKKEKEIWV